MNNRTLATLVIGGVVASSVAGWIAGRSISSPADIAARAAPPTASPVLVPVEERALATEIVTRGTGRFGAPQKLTLATSALKKGAGIISDLPLVGTPLDEGTVALTASGRPLFVLAGGRPMSRDLGPGMTGEDVRQLEAALDRLGIAPGEVDGVYDDRTADAVSRWYTQSGFSPFTATIEQLAAVRAREAELVTARADRFNAVDAVATASASLASARSTLDATNRQLAAAPATLESATAEAAAADRVAALEVRARQRTLDALRSGTGATVNAPGSTGAAAAPASPSEIAAARAELTAAIANAAAVKQTAERTVSEALATQANAPASLEAARADGAAAIAVATGDLEAKQAALDEFLADATSTSAQITGARADVSTARLNLDTARRNARSAEASALATLNSAANMVEAARSDAAAANAAAAATVATKQAALDALTNPRPPTVAEIAAAEHELEVAQANAESVRLNGVRAVAQARSAISSTESDARAHAAALQAAETAVGNTELASKTRAQMVELAQREADLAHRQAGVQVPADEVVFVTTTPVRTSQVIAGKGDQALGTVMLVTNAVVSVDGGLAIDEARLVTTGMTVNIDEPALGIATTGTVQRIAPAPGTDGVDGFHIYFETRVAQPPTNLVGASVRLTIAVQSTNEAVLVVPVNALTLSADGSSRVQRSRAGIVTEVPVAAGLSADGFVEIKTSSSGPPPLQKGDLVVIGVTNPSTSTPAANEPPTSASTTNETAGTSGPIVDPANPPGTTNA